MNTKAIDKKVIALMAAIEHGELQKVESLIQTIPINIKLPDRWERTPLHLAVRHGNLKMVELLLDAGANINETDKDEKTVLHHAVLAPISEEDALMELLLNRGANIKVISKQGETALSLAIDCVSMKSTEVLLEAGGRNQFVDIHADHPNGQLLMKAASIGFSYFAELLLEYNYPLDLKHPSSQDTALHFAVMDGDNSEFVERLVLAGANMDLINKKGQSPLDVAVEKNNMEIIKFLTAARLMKKEKAELEAMVPEINRGLKTSRSL